MEKNLIRFGNHRLQTSWPINVQLLS